MRRHQLSFGIDNFSEKGNYKVHGYIDGNNPLNVLQNLLRECNKIYAPEQSFEEFCKSVETSEDLSFKRVELYTKPM